MQNAAALTAEYELMEALAETAAAAQGRAEATHLVAAMPALAAQLVSRYGREIWPLLPVLIEGTVEVTRLLHAAVVSRPYIRLLPAILLRTVMKLAEAAAEGKEPTREAAADTLANYTGAVLQKHYRSNRAGGFGPGGSR